MLEIVFPPPVQNTPIQNTPVAPVRTLQQPTPSYTPPNAPQASTSQVNNPYDAFNLLLQNSLKTAQKINTTDLLAQQRALQRASIQRTQNTGTGIQPTAEELKFLSPSQQNAIRSTDASALEPSIDEVQYQIKKANQDRKDAIEAIMLAKDSGDKAREFEAEQKWKQADQDYKTATLAETKRSNLASEKAKGTSIDTAPLTPEQSKDPFIQKIVSSKGGKPLTDTSIQKLDKGLVVLILAIGIPLLIVSITAIMTAIYK